MNHKYIFRRGNIGDGPNMRNTTEQSRTPLIMKYDPLPCNLSSKHFFNKEIVFCDWKCYRS